MSEMIETNVKGQDLERVRSNAFIEKQLFNKIERWKELERWEREQPDGLKLEQEIEVLKNNYCSSKIS